MNEEKTNPEIEKEECDTCYFCDKPEECPVPFEVSGQLSSAGYFYCPFWVALNEKNEKDEIPKIVEIPQKTKDNFDKKTDTIFALINEKYERIQELDNEIASLIASYIDLVGEERRKRTKNENKKH